MKIRDRGMREPNTAVLVVRGCIIAGIVVTSLWLGNFNVWGGFAMGVLTMSIIHDAAFGEHR